MLESRRSNALEIGPDQADPAAGPATLLFAPLVGDERLLGYVEILQRGDLPPQLRSGQLQLLDRICRLQKAAPATAGQKPAQDAAAGNGIEAAPRAVTQLASRPDWPAVMESLQHVRRSRRLSDVAGAIANECRLLFDADRVSVAVPYGGCSRVIAVSGQDRVSRRANVIQAMERITELVVATKDPFLFDGGLEEIPPQLEEPLAKFTELGGARMVLIAPLLVPPGVAESASAPALPSDRSRTPQLAGALIIEQMRQSEPQPKLKAHLDLIREPLALELHHARAYDAIWLLPVWTAIGRWRSALRGRRLAWTLIVAGLLTGVTAAMFLVPWNYRVDATGKLMPVVQRDVFAPWDGQVTELLVRGGERIAAGQPLVRLRNDDLAADLARTRGELAEKRKLVVALFAQLDDSERKADRTEETRLRGKVAETQIEVEGLSERLALLTERIDRLTVRSPIAGVVTTFRVEQLLNNRPVQRGDVLVQVMDDNGEWHLELDVPEQRLGHILAAQQNAEPNLPITFRLLTRPEATYQATVSSVGTRAVTSEERGSVVELRAALKTGQVDQPAIGAQVRARIDCGKKPLGYCLFGDVIEFVQNYLWW
jgi:multidrug efflux pump subunit AcrA (membrane-fusion protein)